MNICAVIPSRNHYKMIGSIVQRLRAANLPVFIIDDGSDEPARSAIAALHNEADKIIVYRLDFNQGKGEAVIKGFQLAIAGGFTHALQIDADGQHDLDALPQMLALATTHSETLISGQPIYDDTIPLGRKIGRWVTHIWVWIETLSLRITDSMCGFRIYPLAATQKLLAEENIGRHMDFDTDIMVRLFWRGVAPIMVPLNVIYPIGNISNFQLWRDNWRITKMHTRLFLTMLLRLPSILTHRPPLLVAPNHWANLAERGGYCGLKFCIATYRLLGRTGCHIIMMPIVLYFYLFANAQRIASQQFLTRALKRVPTFRESYRHQMNFAMKVLDVFIAWAGDAATIKVEATNPNELAALSRDSRGALIVVAHLGNVDVARAVLDKKTRERITVLVHTRHAKNYNRILRKLQPEAATNIVQVTDIGPETIIDLQQRVERGEWIVIAGDRTSVLSKEHSLFAPFFGSNAPFPQGPWLLGGLLECPVYLLFCLQENKTYRLTMERFAETIPMSRDAREKSLQACVSRYAQRLEHYAALAPFQWYNFFDFWAR
jgi:predicted LPLAT superfamily acyltransferase/glycosyltransferase involved in cell wall biosynthesis